MSEESFVCNICYEKYDSHSFIPFIAECGHSSCRFCFDEVRRQGIDKCFCRSNIGEVKPNKIVIAILERLDQIQAEYIAIEKSVMKMCPEDRTNGQSSRVQENNIQNASVFVKNIPIKWTLRDLVSKFMEFGAIRTRSFGNYHEVNKGYAVIEFSTSEEAQKAISQGKGRFIGGNQLFGGRIIVEPFFGPQAQRKMSNERQNPIPAEAFRQMSMDRMKYKRVQ